MPVPDGESSLVGWWYSMTSADSKKGAACLANAIVNTAEMAKFGAINTPTEGLASHQARTCS